MKQRTGNEIRQLFLDFFASKEHMIEPGASLIPNNDPTLLWINSGVAALKKYFDGSEQPKSNRIVNAQKSIRTNDIENVGKTARHHTFFEMLGNFSIGDYFKKEAIHYAWEFLTSPEYIGMDKDKLYISVYTDDSVAYTTWVDEIGVDPSHILKTEGNFWEIGAGPSGPDSEIFYDRGIEYDPDGIGEKLFFEELENDRYIEVWNIVFSQYDAEPEKPRSEYKELPQKNIDTGMGLERLVSIVQKGETNYDTDLFLPIIHAVEDLTPKKYEGEYKMAYRVIADHIRTVVFALSDGAMFSNNGRGYVLRRVLRRAVRYGIKLGLNEPFMYNLVPMVSENMKAYYPYLMDKIEYNQNLIKTEEETFHKTLANGEKLLNDEITKMNDKIFSGKVAFKLYDTYGFPYELTEEILNDDGYSINKDEFDSEMEKQKERARNARVDSGSMTSQSADLMEFVEKSEFVGYDNLTCEANIIGLFKDGNKVDTLTSDGEVVFDKTCFYAESGGQVSDGGYCKINGKTFNVKDVKKAPHGQFLHSLEIEDASISLNQQASLFVDQEKRKLTTRNHSATHLLQSALKRVVGDHIAQAGSYVSDEYLRFDFTHFEKVNRQQLDEIEHMVNSFIQQDDHVSIEYLDIEEAKKTGATAMFDEKYGDVVRVVSMGDVSKEFCGGCHVEHTGNIGIFKIVSEESIGSGIRRIIAKTGLSAFMDFKAEEKSLYQVADILKMKTIVGIEDKVSGMIEDTKRLQKEIQELQGQALVSEAANIVSDAQDVNGIKVLVKSFEGVNGGSLKDMASSIKERLGKSVVFLASEDNGKIIFVAAASKEITGDKINCGNLVKTAAQICGGNGGGRPDMAQAGGKDATKLSEALSEIASILGFTL
ncbi:alanyl-tRNA synthetase [Breznakia sp. PF5-3]|uniref:alanine--tRNA ligase n=1 Tax=unclassified Breznakia TaxID=2623764 RepID=UPI002406AF24|nr:MULTISPECIES: alanine--tRNA ligase [unclassified Breznakia]MDF9825321.1 alanyl-tRNA synthetase [Breznakia sp. PM6-1]MDF9836176.1 alanyl-tRNA synthetase [Breznakia sp. PF5-3]MDF9838426.1 alanyl-tRNA synthetase [Breznakia sp. PFB2-8]MDF9860442.1 alanyl-tRNA synthetase [Breznakia sp. PH5-24]